MTARKTFFDEKRKKIKYESPKLLSPTTTRARKTFPLLFTYTCAGGAGDGKSPSVPWPKYRRVRFVYGVGGRLMDVDEAKHALMNTARTP